MSTSIRKYWAPVRGRRQSLRPPDPTEVPRSDNPGLPFWTKTLLVAHETAVALIGERTAGMGAVARNLNFVPRVLAALAAVRLVSGHRTPACRMRTLILLITCHDVLPLCAVVKHVRVRDWREHSRVDRNPPRNEMQKLHLRGANFADKPLPA